MAFTFDFFNDAALLDPVDPLTFIHATDDTLPFVKKRTFFGSPTAAKKVRAASDPGNDQITVTFVDPNLPDGFDPAEVKLALTEAGLDTATPGDPLDLGVQVLSEVANAVEVWVQVIDTNLGSGLYTLAPTCNLLTETGV